MSLRFLLLGLLSLLFACSAEPPPAVPDDAFIGSDACRNCHEAQYADWQGSHHDLAMQVASASTVLGDFDAATFNYFDTETRFLTRDGDYFVRTENAVGDMQDFRVEYTFGVHPLQQYLVATDRGRIQALPFTWDSRDKENGGQRWYHLYADEYIGPDDALFWTRREQNWNYMCAECHSTNLQVNYDVARDSFETTWSEINVACEGCHGPGAVHAFQAEAERFSGDRGLQTDLDDHGRAVWQMNLRTGIAERSELLMRPPSQPEACGRCHARRGLIAEEYAYGKPLADTHRISLLDDPLYFSDGQIHEEVYVYGSFLQSRMYAAGVTCSDCHNPHSATLLTGDRPDDVCSQCHLPEKFATAEHSGHSQDDAGCVDCHMTPRVYMGVDSRRDHSFRIPRPVLTQKAGSPNACNSCHRDQDANWASNRIREWSDTETQNAHFAPAIHNARNGFANDELLAMLGDKLVPGIARGTALTLIAPPLGADEIATIGAALGDGDVQVRMGALRALRHAPPEPQLQLGTPLLSDPVLSARIQAAMLLAPAHQYLPPAAVASFNAAAGEFRAAQQAIASRPEAHASLGDFEAALGNAAESRRHYLQALAMAPDAAVVRVNFADALRRFGDDTQAEALLREGIRLDAGDAALRHSLGLLLARSKRVEEGVIELRRAAELQPGNSRYQYVLAIAINSGGDSAVAIDLLETAQRQFPGDFDIAWALATISRDRGDYSRAAKIAEQLAARYPDNPQVRALLESLAGR